MLGYIDGETATRLIIGIDGLMIARYGNGLPKAFIPSDRARQFARVTGRSMVLSGILYAGLWAFAPMMVAAVAGCAAVVAGIATSLVYSLSLRARAEVA